jgi:hypothetical protein
MMLWPPLEDASPGSGDLRSERLVDEPVGGSHPMISAKESLTRGMESDVVVRGTKSAEVTLWECPRPVGLADGDAEGFVGERLAISEKERVFRSLRGPGPLAVCGLPDIDPVLSVLLNIVTLRRDRRGERARDSLGVLGCETRSSASTDVAAAGGVFFSRFLTDL